MKRKPIDSPLKDRLTLTIPEAAKALSISVRTLYRLRDSRELPLEFRHVGKRHVVLARSIEKALGL